MLGVEEVEGEEVGVAELGPIAVVRKGEGVGKRNKMTLKWTPTAAFCSDSFSFFFHQSTHNHCHILIRKKTGITSSIFIQFQIGSQMLDWVETKYDVTIVSIRKNYFQVFLNPYFRWELSVAGPTFFLGETFIIQLTNTHYRIS